MLASAGTAQQFLYYTRGRNSSDVDVDGGWVLGVGLMSAGIGKLRAAVIRNTV